MSITAARPAEKEDVVKVDVVTGACGFAGNYVVKHLLEKGRKVRATDLEQAHGARQSIAFRESTDKVQEEVTKSLEEPAAPVEESKE